MNLANLHWYDVLLVIIVFVMFYTSIRKLQKNAKNGGGCGAAPAAGTCPAPGPLAAVSPCTRRSCGCCTAF